MNKKPDMPLNANKRPAFSVFTKWDECLRKARKDGEHVVKSVEFFDVFSSRKSKPFPKVRLARERV